MGCHGMADLPSPRGNLVGEGAPTEGSLCPVDPFHSNYQRGRDPSDPYAIRRGCGQHARPLSSATALMGPKCLPDTQLPNGDICQHFRLPKTKRGN